MAGLTPAPTADAAASSGGARAGSSRECALVAALWPVMECELHATLKELIRLHGLGGRPKQAALFKLMYRESLKQRDILGTDLLASLSRQWSAADPDCPVSHRPASRSPSR